MRLFFARHGESEANLLHVMSNRDVQHQLTPTGREQALQLAKSIKHEGIGHIYASPICRARETAEIVAAELEIHFTLTDGLREFDCGILEGCGEEKDWEQHLWVQNQWYFHNDPDARIEGGESFNDIVPRFRWTVEDALRAHAGKDYPILFLTHGAALTAALPILLPNLTLAKLWERGLKYTSYIEAGSDGESLVCVKWNGQPF